MATRPHLLQINITVIIEWIGIQLGLALRFETPCRVRLAIVVAAGFLL